MKFIIAASLAAALAALAYVVCGHFAQSVGLSTGFSPGEMEAIPYVVFILAFFGIYKSMNQPKPSDQMSHV